MPRRQGSTAPAVPREIWVQIFNFTPQHNRDGLLAVNSLLFNLVLSEKYQHVTIFGHHRSVQRAKAYLRHLLRPHILPRIRTCFLSGYTFMKVSPNSGMDPAKDPEHCRIMAALPPGVGSLIKTWLRRNDIFELALKLISALPMADSLKIERFDPSIPGFWEWTQRAWSAFPPRLRRLSITASIDEFAYMVEGCKTVPQLIELKWIIAGSRWGCWPEYYGEAKSSRAFDVMKTFMDNCATSLRKLSIIVRDTTPSGLNQTELLSFLDVSLEQVTNLESFSFSAGKAHFHAIDQLLNIIRRTAESLTRLGVPCHRSHTLQHMTKGSTSTIPLVLGNATHLTVHSASNHGQVWAHPDLSCIMATAEAYLLVTGQPVSLVIQDWPMHIESEIFPFLRRMTGSPCFRSLQNLCFWPHSIKPDLFEELAKALPHLRNLVFYQSGVFDINGGTFIGIGEGSNLPPHSIFCQKIDSLEPLDWRLEHLELHDGRGYYRYHPEIRADLSRSLHKFIPSLLSVSFPRD